MTDKVQCCDCMDFMAQFPDKFFDLTLTDPPYGVGLKYNTYIDTEENWFDLMSRFLPEAIRVSKMLILPSCQIKRLTWIYNNFPPDWLICWYKGSTGSSSFVGFNDWEPHLVYGKNKGVQMHDFFQIQNNEKMGNYNHPCPKPLRWALWFLRRCLNSTGIVFDPFMGSQTTRIAAYKLGFDYYGCELDPDYFREGCKRFEKEAMQPMLLRI